MYDPDDTYDDDFDDDESPVDVIACPQCGAEIYEESVSCPHCGEYITDNSHPLSGRPWWWIALGVLGVVALLASLLVV